MHKMGYDGRRIERYGNRRFREAAGEKQFEERRNRTDGVTLRGAPDLKGFGMRCFFVGSVQLRNPAP